jgi:hypothetical protein
MIIDSASATHVIDGVQTRYSLKIIFNGASLMHLSNFKPNFDRIRKDAL